VLERFLIGTARWVLRHSWITLGVLLLITGFFASQARKVEMYSQFADLLPQGHLYIEGYNEFRKTFGGANVVVLAVAVKEGDIFNTKTLKAIRHVTEKVDQIDGVNHYQVASIAHVKIRTLTTGSGGLILSRPVLPEDIPTDAKELQRLKEAMFNNDIVYEKYISADGKAALILAGFNEERLDYRNIHREIMAIKQAVEDENTVLYAAGEPMLKGWVWFHTGELALIFSVTTIFVLVTLILYFQRFYGWLLPVIGVLTQTIWGLGFVGLLGYNLDPLILVVPVLISARAASHAVQMIERYFEELEAVGDRKRAVANTFEEIIVPGAIGIITDAAGILVLSVATIPLVEKLAFFGAFWSFSNLFTILILMPLLLQMLPTPRKTKHYVPNWMSSLLAALSDFCAYSPKRWVVLAVTGAILVFGFNQAMRTPIGETEAGSPLLWQDSHFNISSKMLNQEFAGANQLVIYLDGKGPDTLKNPAVLDTLENFRRYMLRQPEAGGSRDLPTLVRNVNRLYHYDDPKWTVIPPDSAGVGNMVFMYEAGAPVPGVILEYMDFQGEDGQLVFFYKDTRGDTIRAAIDRAKAFIAAHPVEGLTFRFAGGNIGTTAALNEEIEYSHWANTSLILVSIFALVWLTYQSVVAAILVTVTLISATVVGALYIALKGVGININTLPVAAIGMGVGVDYTLYVIDRIRQEHGRLGDVSKAIVRALRTSGMAVTFTATTLVAGVLPWYFISSLRFSAEMALLLALVLMANWLASITLVPILVSYFKPRFVTRHLTVAAEAEALPAGLKAVRN
jgi:predicted RND superfamily exporter protein